jgi:ribosomal protein S18 acetylase RimI-like enzyme
LPASDRFEDPRESVGIWLRDALAYEPLMIERGQSPDDYVKKLLNLADFGFVLSDSSLAGLVAFYRNDPSRELCYISALAIGPKFRRMGLAHALLEHVHVRAVEYGVRTCQLRVHRDNRPAQQLYLRSGYAIAEIGPLHLVMQKLLAGNPTPGPQTSSGQRVLGWPEVTAHGGLAFRDFA